MLFHFYSFTNYALNRLKEYLVSDIIISQVKIIAPQVKSQILTGTSDISHYAPYEIIIVIVILFFTN